jgi:hypothetical protein
MPSPGKGYAGIGAGAPGSGALGGLEAWGWCRFGASAFLSFTLKSTASSLCLWITLPVIV